MAAKLTLTTRIDPKPEEPKRLSFKAIPVGSFFFLSPQVGANLDYLRLKIDPANVLVHKPDGSLVVWTPSQHTEGPAVYELAPSGTGLTITQF